MYSIEDLKSGKIVIDFRNVKDVDKLQKIIKTAQPKCIDLPVGKASFYYWNNNSWTYGFEGSSSFLGFLVTVNDIII